MRIKSFAYFMREAGRGLARNGLMAVAAATTITFSLLIMGVFLVLVTNLNFVADQAKSQVQLRVFLKPDVTADQAMDLRRRILAYCNDGVLEVDYISKEEAAAQVERTWKLPGLYSNLDENPLPDTLVVQLNRGARLDLLTRKIGALAGVDEIVYRDFIRSLLVVVRILWVVGLSLIILVCLGVLYIIVNTIRLTVFARRLEIEIMKLVGATDWFIRWPFILEGIILGLIGAGIATIVISKSYYFIFKSLQQLAVIPLAPEPMVNNQLSLFLFPAGLLFGLTGSILGVKRFLRKE